MNLDLITKGRLFTSYRDLCNTLGEPVKAGRSKECQLAKFKKHFLWDRQGNAYIITEVFNTEETQKNVIESISQRKLCELLLVDYFKHQLEGVISYSEFQDKSLGCYQLILTKAQISPILGLVNNLFASIKNGKSEHFDVNFARNVRAKNWEIVKDILWNLNNSNTILNHKSFFVVQEGYEGVRTLPMEEASEIAAVYKEVMTSMGFKTIHEIFRKDELQNYYKKINNILSDRYKISYHEECFVFYLHPFVVKQYLMDRVIPINCLSDVKIEINERHVESLYEFFKRQFLKFRNLQESDYMGMKTEYYDNLEDDYLERNIENINRYVKIN